MSEKPFFLSDTERLKAIERTEKEMKWPDGLDVNELTQLSIDKYWQSRDAIVSLIIKIISLSHHDDSITKRVRLKFKNLLDKEVHIKNCPKCNTTLVLVIAHLRRLLKNSDS